MMLRLARCSRAFVLQSTFRQKRCVCRVSSYANDIQSEAEEEMRKVSELYAGSSNSPQLWASQDDVSSYIQQNIDAVLFDCDGVLYRTPDAIPGAADCVQNLMNANKKVLFVTNNAGSSRLQLRDKLCRTLGIEGLSDEQMVSSSYSAAKYLEEVLGSRKRVHVIGSLGLCNELGGYGFEISGGPSDEKAEMDRQELADYALPENPIDAIVVGHDVEFTFRKLSVANVLLQRSPDAIFVATNRDSFDLVGADSRHIPGNGAIVAALEYCSRRKAVNVGKPSSEMIEIIKRDHDLELGRTLFVGDRLDTDIKFAVDNGMISTLVLTGVTDAQKLVETGDGDEEEPLPTAITAHVGILF